MGLPAGCVNRKEVLLDILRHLARHPSRVAMAESVLKGDDGAELLIVVADRRQRFVRSCCLRRHLTI